MDNSPRSFKDKTKEEKEELKEGVEKKWQEAVDLYLKPGWSIRSVAKCLKIAPSWVHIGLNRYVDCKCKEYKKVRKKLYINNTRPPYKAQKKKKKNV